MWPACETTSIKSMRSAVAPARGAFSTSKAPAPSDSIQRRKSFSKAISGLSSISATRWADSGSYRRASRPPEARSEPLASAFFACPARTDR